MKKTMREPRPDDISSDDVLGGIAEGLGCVVMIAVIALFWVGIPTIAVIGAKEYADEQQAELSAQSYTIEGVIASTEVIERPKPEPDPEEESSGSRISISFSFQSPQFTRVTFEDGRHFDFDGITQKPLPIGEYTVLTYNGLKRIVDVQVGQPADADPEE